MAVQNSLAKQPARKMEFGVYLTQNAAKQQINKLLGGQGRNPVHFQYCSRSTDKSGTSRMYKSLSFVRSAAGGGIEAFSISAVGAVLYGSV